jgi:hypothetical protein
MLAHLHPPCHWPCCVAHRLFVENPACQPSLSLFFFMQVSGKAGWWQSSPVPTIVIISHRPRDLPLPLMPLLYKSG